MHWYRNSWFDGMDDPPCILWSYGEYVSHWNEEDIYGAKLLDRWLIQHMSQITQMTEVHPLDREFEQQDLTASFPFRMVMIGFYAFDFHSVFRGAPFLCNNLCIAFLHHLYTVMIKMVVADKGYISLCVRWFDTYGFSVMWVCYNRYFIAYLKTCMAVPLDFRYAPPITPLIFL